MELKNLIANAYDVFTGFEKPDQCTMTDDDPESICHNKAMENTDRHQLTIAQIGPVGHSPVSSFNPAAMACFLPRLIELALANASDIDGDPFIVRFINLVLGGPADTRFKLLQDTHRRIIYQALIYIREHFQKIVTSECWSEELDMAIQKWQE